MSLPLPRLRLVLASKSPARLATLRAAGIEPEVRVSNADEAALLAAISASPAQQVCALATAKALDVASALRDAPGASHAYPAHPGPHGHATFHQGMEAPELPPEAEIAPLVLGCDSMLEIDREVWGKPHTPEVARERLRRMAGRTGTLHTGHCLASSANGLFLAAVSHARVHIAEMSEAEIEAYIATGEPLHVAGSFTVDGFGGPFVEKVDGDYHGVVGLSLPLLRRMMEAQGLSITQLWTSRAPALGELDEKARHFLASPVPFRPAHDSDGFVLCGCGRRHWGLGGASGVAAWREGENGREVLLQHRAAWSHGGATWAIPGGAREWEETSWEGAAREFAEETGIPAGRLDAGGQPRPVAVAAHPDWSYETYVARCEGECAARANRESEELRWVRIDRPLPQPLHPAFAEAWPALRRAIAAA